MKRALVVVDMQNDFLTGSLGSADCAAILPAVKSFLKAERERGTEILFTRDTHGEDYFSTQEGKNLPVSHCVKGTDGWQIADGLYAGEKVFDKPTFGSLELAKYLQEKAFDEVCFIGVCTDICVISNAMLCKAFCPETKVFVKADCMAGTSKKAHEAAVKAMQSCQIFVIE